MTSDTEEHTMRFDLLKTGLADGAGARLGRLAFSGGRTVDTPNFFAVTSRGAVPHVTPDILSEHVQVGGTYIALEDFIEKYQANPTRAPPIYSTPATPSRPRPLHNFTATPPSTLTLLAARRLPAVPSPQGNSPSSISIFTSTGFQNLSTSDYQTAVATLKPDMAIPLADLTNTAITPNSKRAARMAERTEDWLAEWFASSTDEPDSSGSNASTAIFAPTLPIPYSMQWEYLTRLSDDFADSVAGLAVYSADVLPDLAAHAALAAKPRLSLDAPATPHQALRQIGLGADVLLLPFLNSASDSGVALTFSFPAPSSPTPTATTSGGTTGTSLLPLGTDLLSPTSDPSLTTATTPLRAGCACYACAAHHAAYVRHLLAAREMLGWTLLQVHNHAAAAAFLAGVRASLADGSFAAESARFQTRYEPELPVGSGERPRARGYHFKSAGGGEGRRNRKAWERFGGEAEPETERVAELERQRLERGLAETPAVPDGDGAELQERGFAEVDGGGKR